MKPLGDTRTHFWNVQRMARAVGVDLVEARAAGALSEEVWSDMVVRCRACDWAEGCAKWLPQHTEGEKRAPVGCVNASVFAALKI